MIKYWLSLGTTQRIELESLSCESDTEEEVGSGDAVATLALAESSPTSACCNFNLRSNFLTLIGLILFWRPFCNL